MNFFVQLLLKLSAILCGVNLSFPPRLSPPDVRHVGTWLALNRVGLVPRSNGISLVPGLVSSPDARSFPRASLVPRRSLVPARGNERASGDETIPGLTLSVTCHMTKPTSALGLI